MTRLLDVYLYNSLVGELMQDLSGTIEFKYHEQWLNSSLSYTTLSFIAPASRNF